LSVPAPFQIGKGETAGLVSGCVAEGLYWFGS
jgi:hypothetical protein